MFLVTSAMQIKFNDFKWIDLKYKKEINSFIREMNASLVHEIKRL